MSRRRQPDLFVAFTLALVALAAVTSDSRLRADGSGCRFTGIDRIVAIGDIHGAYDRFVEILTASGLVDKQQRWIGGRTHLVQLGDVVDRGPDSAKALDLLKRLEKDAARAGGAVHPLLGNHEVMRVLGDLRFVSPGEYAAFVSSKSEEVRDAYVKRAADLKEPVVGSTAARICRAANEFRTQRPIWRVASDAGRRRPDQRDDLRSRRDQPGHRQPAV